MTLEGKRIVLGVTGGIAAYKAAEILRALVREGAEVQVILTRGALEFVTALTFQTLSGRPVAAGLFDLDRESRIGHIRIADEADVLLVAPASAHSIARLAHGLADDLLATVALATRAPLVVAPAMNMNMYEHPATRDNLALLERRGARIVAPEEGFLACGWQGSGRLASEDRIIEAVRTALSEPTLADERVLVTAGPTREAIDPVRYVSNRSSGRMGYALARATRRLGADVTLVTGPSSQPIPPDVDIVRVTTAAEMTEATLSRAAMATIVIMAAAVSDYAPARPVLQKIKKGSRELVVELTATTDILSELGRRRSPDQILVGFAAETENAVENARGKLERKGVDWIVVNDVSEPGSGFDVVTNRVTLLDAAGGVESWPQFSKDEVATRLAHRLASARLTLRKASRSPAKPRSPRPRRASRGSGSGAR